MSRMFQFKGGFAVSLLLFLILIVGLQARCYPGLPAFLLKRIDGL